MHSQVGEQCLSLRSKDQRREKKTTRANFARDRSFDREVAVVTDSVTLGDLASPDPKKVGPDTDSMVLTRLGY